MLVLETSPSRSVAERRLKDTLDPVPGVLVLNALTTPGGRYTREIDGILLSPHGIYAIEVKGTRQTGRLHTDPNSPWRIGSAEADFSGGPNPLRQARTAAQALAQQLRANLPHIGFISGVVAVSGDHVDVPTHSVGDTHVVDVAHLPSILPTKVTVDATTARAVLAELGFTLTDKQIRKAGFGDPTPASIRAQARAAGHHVTATLREVTEHLPGVLLFHRGSTAQPRRQAIYLSPGGVYALEARPDETVTVAADLRGPDRTPADQAHAFATWIRNELSRHNLDATPVPVVTFTATTQPPRQDDGTWTCSADQLAAVLLHTYAHPTLTAEQAIQVAGALGHRLTVENAVAAGFGPGSAEPDTEHQAGPKPTTAITTGHTSPGPAPKSSGNSRQRRRQERYEATRAAAWTQWRAENRRRIWASAAVGLLLVGIVSLVPNYTYFFGLATASATAAAQLRLRRALPGERTRGPSAVLGWLITLTPAFGIGVLAAGLGVLPVLAPVDKGFALMLGPLTGILIAAAALLGRSSYVFPPATIWERYDSSGRPTGTFTAQRSGWRQPRRLAGDWRPVLDAGARQADATQERQDAPTA